MVSTGGFVLNIGYNVAILAVLIVLFIILVRRPGNLQVYFPAKLQAGKGPPSGVVYRTPFEWLRELFNASEDDLLDSAGLDAVVYIRFFQTGLWILLGSLVYGVLLIPVNYTDSNYEDAKPVGNKTVEYNNLDKLTMGNIKNGGTRLWAHVIGVYWVSFVVYYVLAKTYREVVNLRARSQSRAGDNVNQFAIVVTDIPGNAQGSKRAQQIDEFLLKTHGSSYASAFHVVHMGRASQLFQELETAKSKLARAEAILSKAPGEPRPKHRTGPLGLIGPQVDSIQYWTKEIKDIGSKLRAEQQLAAVEKGRPAAIAFFNSRTAAVAASQTVHAKAAETWQTFPAPEPRAIIWENLGFRYYERTVRRAVVHFATFLIIVFYMIPIAFVSGLSTLDNLKRTLTFLKPVFEIGAVKAILDAFLPQLALIVFLALLPGLLMKLSKSEGILSLGHATRAAAGKYFYFMVFNVFIGFSIGGSLWSQLDIIQKEPAKIISILGKSLPMNSMFFITFIVTKSFTGYGLELSRVVPLIIFHIKKKYVCKTEKEVLLAWKPGPFSYATAVPNDLLIMTLSLCYSIIAPLILPFGIVYFAFGLLVNRRRALNVCVPEFESNGAMWPHISCRILAALLTMQITMVGYMGIKQAPGSGLLIVPLVCTAIFFLYARVKFYPSFRVSSLEVAAEGEEHHIPISVVKDAYTPDCMKSEHVGKVADPEADPRKPSLEIPSDTDV
ncbi:hypothetical protein CBR_g39011 [Chara braunii]|uniref:ERD4-related membrane protein n=1 Tax=Chara braunii TaxID=69332 RepID=A0A388K0W1_CHABU|nr:hypothetical protein CBR_g39011 [Chara braunii]|eukprot:GBG63700.1 hypothetical protein CBR_g39011 [Chara braunii]